MGSHKEKFNFAAIARRAIAVTVVREQAVSADGGMGLLKEREPASLLSWGRGGLAHGPREGSGEWQPGLWWGCMWTIRLSPLGMGRVYRTWTGPMALGPAGLESCEGSATKLSWGVLLVPAGSTQKPLGGQVGGWRQGAS